MEDDIKKELQDAAQLMFDVESGIRALEMRRLDLVRYGLTEIPRGEIEYIDKKIGLAKEEYRIAKKRYESCRVKYELVRETGIELR